MVDLPKNTPAEIAAAGFLQRSTQGMLRPRIGFAGLGERRLPESGFRPLSQAGALQEVTARINHTPATVVFRDPHATDSSARMASASNQDPPPGPSNRDTPKAIGASDSVPSAPPSDTIGDTSVQRSIGSPDPEVRTEEQRTPGVTNDLAQTPERGAPAQENLLQIKKKKK